MTERPDFTDGQIKAGREAFYGSAHRVEPSPAPVSVERNDVERVKELIDDADRANGHSAIVPLPYLRSLVCLEEPSEAMIWAGRMAWADIGVGRGTIDGKLAAIYKAMRAARHD